MAFFAAFEGGAVADLGMADDDRGLIGAGFRLFYRVGHRFDVVGIGDEIDVEHLPILRREPRAHVFLEGDVRVALDGDVVVVVDENELAQRVRARKGAGLVGNPFLETAVAAQHVRIVIHHGEAGLIVFCGQMRLCERHAHAVGDALAERARRRFHACGMAVFGVTGGPGAELAEVHQIFLFQVVAVEVQKRIIEHGAMARGENKSVAVVPFGISRIEFQEILEKRVADRRTAHRKPGMPRFRLLNCFRG